MTKMKCSAAAPRATGQRSLPRLGRMTKIACAASSLLVLGAALLLLGKMLSIRPMLLRLVLSCGSPS